MNDSANRIINSRVGNETPDDVYRLPISVCDGKGEPAIIFSEIADYAAF